MLNILTIGALFLIQACYTRVVEFDPVVGCEIFYDRADDDLTGPDFGAKCIFPPKMPCACTGFNTEIWAKLEDGNNSTYFVLSDDSYFESYIFLRRPTNNEVYTLDSFSFTWGPDEAQLVPFNVTDSYFELQNTADDEWVPFPITTMTYDTFSKFTLTGTTLSTPTPNTPANFLFNFRTYALRFRFSWTNPMESTQNVIHINEMAFTGSDATRDPTPEPTTRDPTLAPTDQPTTLPSKFPTLNPSDSPTPVNGLSSVSLQGNCCDLNDTTSAKWYQFYNETGQNISQKVDCCYGDALVYVDTFMWGFPANGSMWSAKAYECNNSYSGTASFIDNPIGSDPSKNGVLHSSSDIDRFCGARKLRDDHDIPNSFNLSATATYFLSCECAVSWRGFDWTKEWRCNEGNMYDYCSLPNDIYGYVSYSDSTNSSTDDSCTCDFDFEFLEWQIIGDEEMMIGYEVWDKIQWYNGQGWFQALYEDPYESCLNVTVKLCEEGESCSHAPGDGQTFELVDQARGYFETGTSLSLSTDCYCYQMYDICITPNPSTAPTRKPSMGPTFMSYTSTEYIAFSTSTTDSESVDVGNYAYRLNTFVVLLASVFVFCLMF